jgi:PAS domain S-box-containing protein
VWKDTLLQFLVALLPVFAFQIWYDRPGRHRGIPLFIGLLSCCSMLLCFSLSNQVGHGLDVDFRFVPLLAGALYGGYLIAGCMTLIYTVIRIPMLSGSWEIVSFILFLLVFIPILFLAIRPFQRAGRAGKQRIALKLAGLLSFFILGTILLFFVTTSPSMPFRENYHVFVDNLFIVLGVWAFVFIIESVKEKQQLHYQLHRMSLNYRNEVQKLQQFIDVTPLGVVITDREGVITNINENAIQSMGETEGKRFELIGRPYTEIHREIADTISEKMLIRALNGDQTRSEIVHEHQKIYIKTGFSVRDLQNNDIIGAALIAHDITELSRLKDEIRRMDRLSLVGQMAASITHEIRNPLAVIRGFVQLMRERSPDHHQEYYRIIMEELDRTNSIINDFLSLAQNRVIEKEICSLHDIIEDLEPLLRADANLRGQTLELDLWDGMPLLELNPKEIKQLILNLARNGMEAMEDKGLLKLVTKVEESAVILNVTDTGVGIPREKLERLFEPFYTTKTRGTGLGLPLCLSIAERHNGIIEVSSVEGKGTSFIVTFARNG